MEQSHTLQIVDVDQDSIAATLQVGDTVGFNATEHFPLAIGMILSIKADDCGIDCVVVQVGPNVIGVYRSAQLVRLHGQGVIEQQALL